MNKTPFFINVVVLVVLVACGVIGGLLLACCWPCTERQFSEEHATMPPKATIYGK